jgi:hypothetical protein
MTFIGGNRPFIAHPQQQICCLHRNTVHPFKELSKVSG